jgi:hypothetical protein
MKDKTALQGRYRTEIEKKGLNDLERVFIECTDSVQVKLQNYIKYVREQELRRLLALYEIFKKVLPVKGSVIECGVYKGFGLMTWALLSSTLEPINLTRRIYGFDTFDGFSSVAEEDKSQYAEINSGCLSSNSFDELNELIKIYDNNRFLGHIQKVQLIKGDASITIPEFIHQNKHLVVSLLFLDFDLYEPTKIAIENFLPRMPKGSIIAFDELDNPIWPGETEALLDSVGISKLKLERLTFDPYIGYAVID